VSIRLRLNRGSWLDAPYREMRRSRVKFKWSVCRQCGQGSWFQVDGYQVCRDFVAHIDRAIADREQRYRNLKQSI
jgi:hypothetical protein